MNPACYSCRLITGFLLFHNICTAPVWYEKFSLKCHVVNPANNFTNIQPKRAPSCYKTKEKHLQKIQETR
jgi:hypothetical protein